MPASIRRVLVGFAAAVCTLSLAAGICLFAALRNQYDTALRHFTPGAPFAAAAAALCILALLCGAVSAVLIGAKKISAAPECGNTVAVFAATLVGFLLFASFILDIRTLADAQASLITRLRPALGALAAIYFLATATRKEAAPVSVMQGVLAIVPILYGFVSVMTAYFDTAYGMNAPLKNYALLTYLAVTLFFSGEARMTLGRMRTWSYVLFASCCTVMCLTLGVSRLAIGLISAEYGFVLMENAVLLACALFAAVRLFSMEEVPVQEEESAEAENTAEVSDANN